MKTPREFAEQLKSEWFRSGVSLSVNYTPPLIIELIAARDAERAPQAAKDACIEAMVKCLIDGARMVESAYVHVSHGGPTREEASLWVARADELLRALGRKVEP
jgi:hypothetical protein